LDLDRIGAAVRATRQAQQAAVRATLESGLVRWFDRAFGRLDDIAPEAWERARRSRRHFDAATETAHERAVGFQRHLILAA
jgi:hypothetical protein